MNKMQRFFIVFVVLALLLAAPYMGLPVHVQSLLYVIFFWMTLATSWNMLSGYSGYFSFGHGAFFGVGMYGMATLATKADWPVVPAALGSGFLAALLALAIGALVFNLRKVRGESFALITMAVGFVLATVVVNTPIDGGPGVYLMGVSLPQWGPKPASTFYSASLVLTVLCVAAAWWLFHARAGMGLLAIHDDEDAAEVNGVPTFWLKMGAFALSSFFAGVMGAIHALYVSYVTVGETFNITVPLTVVLMSVLGCSRHLAGPMVGGIFDPCFAQFFHGRRQRLDRQGDHWSGAGWRGAGHAARYFGHMAVASTQAIDSTKQGRLGRPSRARRGQRRGFGDRTTLEPSCRCR